MKNISKILFSLLVLSLVLVGCNKDDYTGDSKVVFNAPNASYTNDAASMTIDEMAIDPDDGLTVTIEATLSEAVQFDTYIDLTQTGGTMSGGDYEVSRIYVPALHTTGTGTVTFFRTGDVEGDETLDLTANTNSANVNGSVTYSFTMTNDYINDVLSFTFDWSGSYTYDAGIPVSVTMDYCEIDLDFLLFDSSFNLLPFWDAATGSCPEALDIYGLSDGTYYLVSDLWDNPYDVLGTNQDLPIRVSYSQEYFSSGNFVYGGYNTDDSSGTYIMAQIDVTDGYNYVVTPF